MTSQHIVFGPNGMIGSALLRSIRKLGGGNSTILVSRSGTMDFKTDLIPSEIPQNILDKDLVFVYWCQGPTDPAIAMATHEKYSFELPHAWAKWFFENTRLQRFITFGSVHETFAPICDGNSYLTTKRKWFSSLPTSIFPYRHFQLHTLYGEPFRATSFVGQIVSSLRTGNPFKMSHGRQLREYHLADDISDLVVRTLHLDFPENSQAVKLSHGRPVRLCDLAQGIFKSFGMENQLEIGATPTRAEEVLELNWKCTPEPFTPPYRDAVAEIVERIRDPKVWP